jgi:hypothetical protein
MPTAANNHMTAQPTRARRQHLQAFQHHPQANPHPHAPHNGPLLCAEREEGAAGCAAGVLDSAGGYRREN